MSRFPKTVVREVGWDDPVGETLRQAMEDEMRLRYADRLAQLLSPVGDQPPAEIMVDADHVVYVGVAYDENGVPVGHAALVRTGDDLELKRVYVTPERRGTGVSVALLVEAENAGRALGASRIILQTGDRQPDAVRLYEREGYTRIPSFSPPGWVEFSTCMEKPL